MREAAVLNFQCGSLFLCGSVYIPPPINTLAKGILETFAEVFIFRL